MRFNLVLLLFIFSAHFGFAQGDFPTTKPLDIKADNNLDIKTTPEGTALRMPSVIDENLLSDNDEPVIKMLPDRELVQAGHDLVIDPEVTEKSNKKKNEYFGDQYLGDVNTTSSFVGIVCRDHEYVDGDRVKIFLNGDPIEYNVLLTGSFKGINVDLVEGFNRIDFQALNEGSSSPNTAQVIVTDDKGQVIHDNRWNLSTGSVGSLIVVKKPSLNDSD